jgi:hypothetical protein
LTISSFQTNLRRWIAKSAFAHGYLVGATTDV